MNGSYGFRRPKFFRAEHSATAEDENGAYGQTLQKLCKTLKHCFNYRFAANHLPHMGLIMGYELCVEYYRLCS